MHILLEDMLMCLIFVIDNFHCLLYIQIARQMKTQPPKIECNLSAKRWTLKPCNSKRSPMTPDFLYDFLILLQSRNWKYTSQKMDVSPNIRGRASLTTIGVSGDPCLSHSLICVSFRTYETMTVLLFMPHDLEITESKFKTTRNLFLMNN